MGPWEMSVLASVISGLTLAGVGAIGAMLRNFASEQREVNKANAEANRSMQRDVLYRYFHKAVELQEPLTPEEYKHVSDCYAAYAANGGNGAGVVMWDRIREFARIDTGRSGEQ